MMYVDTNIMATMKERLLRYTEWKTIILEAENIRALTRFGGNYHNNNKNTQT